MKFVKSGLNSEQISLIRPICIENYISELKQVVLIAMMVLILGGPYSGTLYCSIKSNEIFHDL